MLGHLFSFGSIKFYRETDYNVEIEYTRIREEYGNMEDVGNLMSKLHWENTDEASFENWGLYEFI